MRNTWKLYYNVAIMCQSLLAMEHFNVATYHTQSHHQKHKKWAV